MNEPARPAPLAGCFALVSGGARGIGRAVAAALLRAGAGVVLTGTKKAAAEAAAAALMEASDVPDGAAAFGIQCDVRSWSDCEAAAAFVRKRADRLDLLVNNAGVGIYKPTAELTEAEFRRVVDTNLTGVFLLTKACLPLLRETEEGAGGGTVVNIGSLAGRHAFARGAAYNASKFGLVGLTEALMLEFRGFGARVATVMPGSVATGFAGRSPDDGTEWKLRPEDVAEAVLHVALSPAQALPSRIELRPSRPQAIRR